MGHDTIVVADEDSVCFIVAGILDALLCSVGWWWGKVQHSLCQMLALGRRRVFCWDCRGLHGNSEYR